MDIIIWKPVHYGQFIQVFVLLYKERYSELCFTLHHSQAPDVIYFSHKKNIYEKNITSDTCDIII